MTLTTLLIHDQGLSMLWS